MSRSRRPNRPHGLLAGVIAAEHREWLAEFRRKARVASEKFAAQNAAEPYHDRPAGRCDCGCWNDDDEWHRPMPAQRGPA